MTGTATVVMYGCSPFDWDRQPMPPIMPPPSNPWWPGPAPAAKPEPAKFQLCVRCARHIREGEPCPFCMHDDIARLEQRINELLEKEVMPLIKSSSNKAREKNIKEMIAAGHSPPQAVAAGYANQRAAAKKKKKKK